MAFFSGDLDGKNGHDDLAKKIAYDGKAWANQYWRYVDMQACEDISTFNRYKLTVRFSFGRCFPPVPRVGACDVCVIPLAFFDPYAECLDSAANPSQMDFVM